MKKSDQRWNDESIIPSCGNVFVDLGFHPAEAEVMNMRIELIARITEQIRMKGWTQVEVAHQLGTTNQLASQILNGKIESLSFEMLLMLAVQAGLNISLTLSNRSPSE